jgi:hypothetical protein
MLGGFWGSNIIMREYLNQKNIIRIFIYSTSFLSLVVIAYEKGPSYAFNSALTIIILGLFWYENEVFDLKKERDKIKKDLEFYKGLLAKKKNEKINK